MPLEVSVLMALGRLVYFRFFHSLLVRLNVAASKFMNPRLDFGLAEARVAAWETLVSEIAEWRLSVVLEETTDETFTYFIIMGKFTIKPLWTLVNSLVNCSFY